MKTKTIGNPETFAVEFTIWSIESANVYGGCRLWMEGKYLGDIEEPAYLSIVSRELKNLIENFDPSETKGDFNDVPLPKSVREFIEISENENIKWNVGLIGETFDNFRQTYYQQGKKFIFYWCLSPDNKEFRKSYNRVADFPDTVQRAEIEIDILKEVSAEFENTLANLINNEQNNTSFINKD